MLLSDLAFDWYHIIALPKSIVLILVTAIIVIISKKVKKMGINITSFIMFGSAIIVVCLEGILDFAIEGKIKPAILNVINCARDRSGNPAGLRAKRTAAGTEPFFLTIKSKPRNWSGVPGPKGVPH